LPVGQHEVTKWPVLDLGEHPDIAPSAFTLAVEGEVERPRNLSWADLMALPQTEDVSDFHCVTRWSRMDIPWVGVRFQDLMAEVGPMERARHLFIEAWDGYTTNLPLEEAMKPDVLLVHTAFGAPLAREHGGPLRMITPQLYAWKGAKWIRRIEVREEDRLGFWEQRGYSNTARP
ncbi:MAG: molybdopterin-dependent oxidoreductase, partial [Myxococcales bacterium]|nr:molybdopterin-dependent oxidoreductase [Myxococcales bacterium]